MNSRNVYVTVPREQLQYIRDLLTEKVYGSSARSPGHNARLVVDDLLSAAPPVQMEAVAWRHRSDVDGIWTWAYTGDAVQAEIYRRKGHEVELLYASPVPSSERDDDIDALQREVSGLSDENERLRAERSDIIEMCKALEDAPLEQLRDFQTQLDPHGEFVGVSRQALDEVLSVVFPIRDRLSLKSQPAQESGEGSP